MTRRRRLVLSGTGIALLTCAAVGSWLVYCAAMEPDPVQVYERITLGMTTDEVIALIGRAPNPSPADDFDLYPDDDSRLLRVRGAPLGSAGKHDWVILPYRIWVAVDKNGVVGGAALFEYRRRTLFDRINGWLGF